MSEFKITNTLYYQGKQLWLAKAKLCRELAQLFMPMVARLDRALTNAPTNDKNRPF